MGEAVEAGDAARTPRRERARPTRLGVNVAANYGGTLWSLLVSIAFVPVYVAILGIEPYGLVGFYAVLQSMITLLGMGLGLTLNRELAIAGRETSRSGEARRLVRTLEIVCWGAAVATGVIMLVTAPAIASKWIRPGSLTVEEVTRALRLMAMTLAVQLPLALYSGGLMGLQRQVQYNVLLAVGSTFRGIGVIGILLYVSPTIEAFFVWHTLVSVAHTGVAGLFLWRALPASDVSVRFDARLLRRLGGFAAGVSVAGVAGVVLGNLDRLLLSRLLTLETFGYYSLAAVVASAIYLLANPVYIALFPRLSQLISAGDRPGALRLYHNASQLIAVVLLPIVAILVFFAEEVLLLWTQNAHLAVEAAPLLGMLSVSALFIGLNGVTYQLQLAHGRAREVLILTLVTLAAALVAIPLAATRAGATGAATTWIGINLCYTLIGLHLAHRALGKREELVWYARDILPTLLVSALVAGAGRALRPDGMSPLWYLAYLTVVSILTLASAAAATLLTRRFAQGASRLQDEEATREA